MIGRHTYSRIYRATEMRGIRHGQAIISFPPQGVVVPAALRTEKMPKDTKPLLAAIARAVRFTPEQLLAARRVTLPIERREEELFEGRMARRMIAQGVISDLFATHAAHKVLSVCDHIPVADLGRALMARLSSQLQEQRWTRRHCAAPSTSFWASGRRSHERHSGGPWRRAPK